MIPKRFRVKSNDPETEDTSTLILNPLEEGSFSFLPGQYNMLDLFGFGEVPISICSDPLQKQDIGHTIRAVGLTTKAFTEVKAGDEVGVRGPFGTPWPLSKKGKDVLLIGGGLGLAPLRPALFALAAGRSQYKSVTLLYGARSPDDLLYKNELADWAKKGIQVEISVDCADAGWRGNVGVITRLIHSNVKNPQNSLIFLCGPEIMMKFALIEILRFPIPEHEIYLSLERNMKCSLGFCGHCQLGPYFLCKDGPVFSYDQVKKWMAIKEL